ncbi:MAG: DNA double-strand break repair nuclease NurA, partial [Candidatus Micrarchaeota archaeon]
MHWSASSINRILTSVTELREQCTLRCTELKKISSEKGFKLVSKVNPTEINGVVAAVDSGFSSRQFVSLDVLLLRSVASIFTYEKNNLVASQYFPNRVPGVSIHYGIFSDATESSCFKSLSRLSAELSCGVQTVKMYSPAMLLIDGSLLPLASDKPPQDSSLSNLYNEVIGLYGELYSICKENNCELVGVVKDSRSQKLCSLLEKKLGGKISINSDEFLSNMLLASGERTVAFPLEDAPFEFAKGLHC